MRVKLVVSDSSLSSNSSAVGLLSGSVVKRGDT